MACVQVQNVTVPHTPEEELNETLGDFVGDLTESHSRSQSDLRCLQHKRAVPVNPCSTTLDEERDTDTEPTPGFRVKEAKARLQYPHQDCTGKPAYSKETHLHRHYKMRKVICLTVHYAFSKGEANDSLHLDVSCNVQYGCGEEFDRVDRFERHLRNCLTMRNENRGGAIGQEDRDACRMQTLDLKKHWSSVAKMSLNQTLARVVAEAEQKMTSESYISNRQLNPEVNMEHRCQKLKRANPVRKSISINYSDGQPLNSYRYVFK
jgi:hypothetical protein